MNTKQQHYDLSNGFQSSNKKLSATNVAIFLGIAASITALIGFVCSSIYFVVQLSIAPLDEKITAIDKRIDTLDKRIDGLDKRIDGIDRRIDKLEENVNSRFDKIDTKLDRLLSKNK